MSPPEVMRNSGSRVGYCLTGMARILSTISLVRSPQARIDSSSAHLTSTVVRPALSMSTLMRPALPSRRLSLPSPLPSAFPSPLPSPFPSPLPSAFPSPLPSPFPPSFLHPFPARRRWSACRARLRARPRPQQERGWRGATRRLHSDLMCRRCSSWSPLVDRPGMGANGWIWHPRTFMTTPRRVRAAPAAKRAA